MVKDQLVSPVPVFGSNGVRTIVLLYLLRLEEELLSLESSMYLPELLVCAWFRFVVTKSVSNELAENSFCESTEVLIEARWCSEGEMSVVLAQHSHCQRCS